MLTSRRLSLAALCALLSTVTDVDAQRPAAVAVVQPGDTLWAIAERHGVTVTELEALNPELSDPDTLRVGDRLRVAGDTEHTVRRGETLSGLAARYGTTVAALREANGLSSDQIDVGQTLRVPTPAEARVDPADPGPSLRRVVRPSVQHRRAWSAIVVHHTATTQGSVEQIDHYHRNVRGFHRGLAYHFVIGNGHGMGDGEIQAGPRWRLQQPGAHVASHLRDAQTGSLVDDIAIGIALVGNFEDGRPSPKQRDALRRLVARLRHDHGIAANRLYGHGEVPGAHTACPGRLLSLDALR